MMDCLLRTLFVAPEGGLISETIIYLINRTVLNSILYFDTEKKVMLINETATCNAIFQL